MPGDIDHFEVHGDGSFSFQGEDLRVTVTPPRVQLLTVTNFGVSFAPPTEHLGSPIDADPIVVAEAGIRYYADFLTKVKEKFF